MPENRDFMCGFTETMHGIFAFWGKIIKKEGIPVRKF